MRRIVTVLIVVIVSACALALAQNEFRIEIDTVRTGEIPTEQIDHVYLLDLPAGVPRLSVSVDAHGDDADLAVYFGPHDEELFYDVSIDPYPRFDLASPRAGRYRIVVKNLLWQPLRYEVSVSSGSERAPVATPAGHAPALTLRASVVAPGASVEVSFGGAPGNQRDWVGMFAAEAEDRAYLTYQYTQGARNGVLTFRAPDHAGRYDLRLFEDDGYTLLARTTTFEVRTGGPSTTGPAARGPAVVVSQVSMAPGQAFEVLFSDAPGHAADWVGLFEVGASDRQYLTYQYTQGSASGALTFAAPLEPGRYEARLFENDGYELLARSGAFEVLADARGTAPSGPGPAPAQDVVSGEWRLDANGHRGSLRFVPTAGGWVGTFTLGGRDETLEDVSFDGVTLRFTRPLGTATQRYEGTLTTAGATLRWSGTFYQGAARSPFPWSAER